MGDELVHAIACPSPLDAELRTVRGPHGVVSASRDAAASIATVVAAAGTVGARRVVTGTSLHEVDRLDDICLRAAS